MNNLLLISLEGIGEIVTGSLSSWGIWYHLLYNLIGAIAVILKIIELQLKNRSKRLVLAMSSAVCWVIYFFLCGKVTASITSIIAVIQSLIFLQRGKKAWAESIFWLFLFLGVQLGICVWNVMSGEGILVLLSVFAGLFGTMAYFVKNDRAYRILVLISLLFWVANSIVGTFFSSSTSRLWAALASDVFGTTSAIIAIIRYDIIKAHKQKS
jgi:hypothetical protein